MVPPNTFAFAFLFRSPCVCECMCVCLCVCVCTWSMCVPALKPPSVMLIIFSSFCTLPLSGDVSLSTCLLICLFCLPIAFFLFSFVCLQLHPRRRPLQPQQTSWFSRFPPIFLVVSVSFFLYYFFVVVLLLCRTRLNFSTCSFLAFFDGGKWNKIKNTFSSRTLIVLLLFFCLACVCVCVWVRASLHECLCVWMSPLTFIFSFICWRCLFMLLIFFFFYSRLNLRALCGCCCCFCFSSARPCRSFYFHFALSSGSDPHTHLHTHIHTTPISGV